MDLWAVIAAVVIIAAAGTGTAYRRQIKKICRQLAFLKENKTNLRLTSDLPFSELGDLIDSINEVIDQSREVQKKAQQTGDSLKETMTYLSHDIRTPLTSMDGYFQLLAQSESEAERRLYIAVIQSRITSLKDMLEELFTYTRMLNDDYELVLEPVDFGKCVYEAVFSFYDELQQKGIEPELNLWEGRLYMNGNNEAIRRILQNIIKNALEHGQKQISLSLHKNHTDIIFRCSNDVPDPDTIIISQVFSRFYKADAARSSASTGLGLSIAKGLTERMGGKIRARLENAVFTVEIQFQECSAG